MRSFQGFAVGKRTWLSERAWRGELGGVKLLQWGWTIGGQRAIRRRIQLVENFSLSLHLTVSNNLPGTRCAVTSFAGFSAFCSLMENLPMLSCVQLNPPYKNLGPRRSASKVAPLVLQINGFESCYQLQGTLEDGVISSQSRNGVRECSASREHCNS